ncbi:Inositol 1,4,5-trisphosphate receptor-interacting protein-like 2 [Bagarius yarrelli]|uniref:Inositol 1,4,5-trisphosphate receptor-interacting protein-like 2 n=1 Tax=Bagarius yarrelli TaxID=175774 RepID=A0A556V023_BAGYA|nr:Inositol 1,4,5-trisphosphate receptor-interacting protein-like 2 [Bagarius yarrelli]
MSVYTLNLRIFWFLVVSVLGVLLLLHHFLLRGSDERSDGCSDQGTGSVSLIKYVLAFALCYFFIRYCSSQPQTYKRGLHAAAGKPTGPKRELLEEHFQRHVRLSPHVLGHSKAHVAKLVSELVRVGRADVLSESSLAFRGDFIQIGSSYEEHKVGSPDCFDVLVPLRLPRGLKLEPCCHDNNRGGAPLVTLETSRKEEWPRRHKSFTDTYLCLNGSPGVYRFGPDSVMRWFYCTSQRCLSAVRYPFEQRCLLGLSLIEGQRVQLHLTPRSDYVCCHISMGVRLIPALPLGDSVFLVPSSGAQRSKDLWMIYFPKQEQKLLGWLKAKLPSSSCHLKCLQLLKEVRDLGGQTLDQRAAAEWKEVLSSYVLKTAWLRHLLSTPSEAWDEHHIMDRMEDLLRFLREGLQSRSLRHLLLGGDKGLLPESVALPKVIKETVPSNLWAEFSAEALDLVAARLSYSWTHLPRLIRLGRPQRTALGRGLHCKHLDAE